MSLEIRSLTKRFDEKCVLDSFSYSFEDKGLYVIAGESGIGKTTLLRIIAGLDKDYVGEVIGGGIGQVSVAFQEHRLFPTVSALENAVISIYKEKNKADFDKAKELLKLLGIGESEFHLRPSQLSGGMKQRVSIARAILFDAPILLLDEPTKELDKANADAVLELVASESRRRLVIMVSHETAALATFDHKKIDLGTK